MGKLMKKTKIAVTEVAQSVLGVRTRSKTLALHRLHSSASPEAGSSSASCSCSRSFLQLRNRRLEKLLLGQEKCVRKSPELWSEGSVSLWSVDGDDADETIESGNSNGDVSIEASFGENVMEVEGRERSTGESTPCNLIRNSDIIRTPGVTSASGRVHSSVHRDILLASEIDDFFTAAEKEQQKSFMDKYNFDPATDKPLPGRFQWKKVDPQK